MPSPIGHCLAGVCGFMLTKKCVPRSKRACLLIASVGMANLANLDVLPGLLLGDPRIFHHRGTHSLIAAAIVSLLMYAIASRAKLVVRVWTIWAGSLYLSHVILDLLVSDPIPPFGVQLFWPFSRSYFISPATPFPRFDYFDPTIGIVPSILTAHNGGTILVEMLLFAPFLGLSWYIGSTGRGGYLGR